MNTIDNIKQDRYRNDAIHVPQKIETIITQNKIIIISKLQQTHFI